MTLTVSWMGRLQVSPDTSAERVQVDLIRFELAEATLTPEGQTQVMRVVELLEQVGEVSMALKKVV